MTFDASRDRLAEHPPNGATMPFLPHRTHRSSRIARRRWYAAATACLTLAVPGAATAAQAPSTLQRDVDALVAAGAPGAILLVRDGAATQRLHAGLSDVERGTPMRGDEHFKIASLTKTYTATVVLQLVQERRLALGDSVAKWLPGLVPNGHRVTIRQLLNHTSGFAEYESDERYLKPYLGGNFGFYWSPRKLVELAVSHPPVFAPGQTKAASYSNTNYVLLGLVVEKVTSRSIGAELGRRIFRPLGLRHTIYQTKPGLPSPYAHGYLVLGNGPATDVTGLSPSLSPASGAIVSTAAETTRFYRALLSGRLLAPQLLKAMKTTISSGEHVDIPGQRYGFGLESFPTPCGRAWGHNGVVPGYFTFVFANGDGSRQALLMVNHDAQTLPAAAGPLYMALIAKAYCSTR